MDDLLERLNSSVKEEWRRALQEIDGLMSQGSPNEFYHIMPSLFEAIRTAADEELIMQLSCKLRSAQEKFPLLSQDYDDIILQTLRYLAENFSMDTPDSFAGNGAICLLSILMERLQQDQELLKKGIDVLFLYLRKSHQVNSIALGVLNTWIYRSPHLFSGHIVELVDLVKSGKKEFLTTLMSLYPQNSTAFESADMIEFLVDIAVSDVTYQTAALNLLLEISKKEPALLASYASTFRVTLQSPMTAAQTLMIYGNIAREQPNAIKPFVSDIYRVVQINPQVKALIPNILGLIGRISEEDAAEMLALLGKMLEDKDQTTVVQVLVEMKNLGELNRELLTPYINLVRMFVNDPQEYIRTQAQAIIDYYEGRDLRSLIAKFEQLNEEVKAAVQNFDDLKKYVDDHVAELKEFISEINKKLPIPNGFSSQGRIRKTLTLYFTCSRQTERCLFPPERPFTTQTKEFSRWLKVAISAVKFGAAVVLEATTPLGVLSAPGMASKSLDLVKQLYTTLKDSPNDAEFLSIVREPFLTSEEQDFLIKQLRDAKYFQFFQYDPQTASWVCSMCAG